MMKLPKHITKREHKKINKLVEMIKKNFGTINEQNLFELDRITYLHTPDIKNDVYYLDGMVRTCIQFKRFPAQFGKGIMDCFKGSPFMMLVIDEEHLSNETIVEFMGKKIDAMDNDYSDVEKKNEVNNAKKEMITQNRFTDRIFSSGETCKYVTVRLYLKHQSLQDLNKLIDWVNKKMASFDICGCVQRNMLDNDLQAITKFSNPTKSIVTTRGITNMIMSDDVSEVKPMAMPLGSTNTGAYCPDFMSYLYRSFCLAILGMQGCGKSALIKKMIKQARARNEQVIIFDMHNKEYGAIAEAYDIPSLSLSMQNTINHYQIFRNDENSDIMTDITISEQISLVVSTLQRFAHLESNDDRLTLYANVLADMYEKYKGKSFDQISDEKWMIVSDVITYLDIYMKEHNEILQEWGVSLKQKLLNMQNQYGFFFDCYTNINLDLTKSFRVDMSFLENFETDELRDSYVAMMLSFLGKVMRQNEVLNAKLELKLSKPPVRPLHPLLVVFEETGTFFKKMDLKKRVDIAIRQSRKARTGFIFAFHTIKDINGGTKEDADLSQSIFGLCSAIILGQIDKVTAEELPSYAKHINHDDTHAAEKFIVADDDKEKRRIFLACTDDGKKIRFKSKVLPSEYNLFGGGR